MYRDNPALVRCWACTVELPLEAAAPAAEGHLCGRCGAARFARRATLLVLAGVLGAPIVHGVCALFLYARVVWWGLPSLAERAAELAIFDLAALALIALAIRASTPRRPPPIGPLSSSQIVNLIALALASIAGTAGSVWLPYKVVERVSLPVTALAAYSRESSWLSLAGIALHAAGMLLLFVWSIRSVNVPPAPPASGGR